MKPLEKAEALAFLGVKTFPAREEDEWIDGELYVRKSPYTKNGVLDATDDRAQLTEWWKRWPNALVGYATGASGLLVADLDIDNEKGRDGWHTVEELELELPDDLSYDTPRGGSHFVYRAPAGLHLGPTTDHRLPDGRIAQGIDRRAGNSYAIWYGDSVPWDLDIPEAPDWLLTPTNMTTGSAFNGSVVEWLESIPQGSPSPKVLAAMARIPLDEDFGHTEMVERQFEIVRLAAEGEPGVHDAIDLLKDEWLREPYSTAEYLRDFNVGLVGAIRKAGAIEEPAPSKELVQEFLPKLPDGTTPLIFGVKDANERRQLLTALKDYPDEEVVATVFHASKEPIQPSQIHAELVDIRNGDHRTELDAFDNNPGRLLSDAEREIVKHEYKFVDHYCAATSKLNRINRPYHVMNAWQFLALLFGEAVYVGVDRGMNSNLFGFVIGESGTGKTESMHDLREALEAAGILDHVDIDYDASHGGLSDELLKRDGQAVWFNTDEADSFLSRILPQKGSSSVWSELQPALTKWYDTGRVSPKLRRNQNPDEVLPVHVYLSIWLGGTEDAILSNLTVEQVKKGFVARFITVFGDPKVITRATFTSRVWDGEQILTGKNPYVWELGEQMAEMKEIFWKRRGKPSMPETPEVATRIDDAKAAAYSMFEADPLWELIEPNVKRINDVIWKLAALHAASTGRRIITMKDALVAIEATEGFLASSLRLMRGIRSSVLIQTVEKVAEHFASRRSISKTATYRWLFRSLGLSKKDADEVIGNLIAQGRLTEKGEVWSVVE